MANQVWNSREETGRGNNWKNNEVINLLNTIKKNNLMKGSPSGKQLGQLVEPLMGFTRTAFQITGKLKNLRMSYLSCKRRESTQSAHKKCPHYNLLSEIYNEKFITNDAKATDNMLKETNTAKKELMLYIGEKLAITPGPRLLRISYNLMLETARYQIVNGLHTSPNQVKNILKSRIKSFAESKECKSMDKNEALRLIAKMMPHYDSDQSDCWSPTGTSVMQNIIEELNLKKTENVSKIQGAVIKKGYHRSSLEVREKAEKMKNTFLQAEHAEGSESHGISRDFLILNSNEGSLVEGTESSDEKPNLLVGKTKHSRSRAWSDVETTLMLSVLQDLNLTHHIAHRLSFEVVQEIVEPLQQHGYARSPLQIQIKLRNLRKSYYKCLRAGRTEMAIAKCPFFHKLNEIYEKSHTKTKLAGGSIYDSMESDDRDVSESLSSDQYYNTLTEEPHTSSLRFQRTSDADSESSQMWMPVETICGEDSPAASDDEKPKSPLDDENESRFDEIVGTENYGIMKNVNGSNDVESHEGSIDECTKEDTREILSRSKKANGAVKKAARSQKSSNRLASSKLRSTKRKMRENVANSRFSRTKKNSTLSIMRIVMAQLLRHEKLLQRQHQSWMERQFEIQRKHDRDHRELFMKELREFRESFNSAMAKQQTVKTTKELID